MQKQVYSIQEFAAAYGVSRSTVYKEIETGRLRILKVGRRTLISLEAAAAWLAGMGRQSQ